MLKQLPARPSLEQLKNQAKDLLSLWRARDASALERVSRFRFGEARPALAKAQLVVAREYGFVGWAKLKSFVEASPLSSDRAARKLLEYALIDSIAPNRERTIRAHVDAYPSLESADLSLACLLGNAAYVREALAAEPAVVHRKVGFADREPLLYACFSWFLRHDETRKPGIREVVRLLIGAGADPNAGYDWQNTPLSALYGASGVCNDPETVRILLDAGANVNDGECCYHSVEHRGHLVLELLFEREIDEQSKSHAIFRKLDFDELETVEWLLEHGVDPNQRWRPDDSTPLLHAIRRFRSLPFIELLLDRGADPNLRDSAGTGPYSLAKRLGRDDVSELLLRRGAKAELGPFDSWIAAAFEGMSGSLSPPDFANLPKPHRYALHDLAGDGEIGKVRALLEAGFPVELADYTTPLHWACWKGRPDVARLLIERAAPLETKDRVYGGTPFGWTCHGSTHCGVPAPENYLQVAASLSAAGAALPSAGDEWWQAEGGASPELQAWLLERV